MKKIINIIVVLCFMLVSSCGTIIKYGQINKPVTNKLDYMVVALDGIGLVLFIIPGVVAFSIDYMTGTIFLPAGPIDLKNRSAENIQQILAKNNINMSIEQLNSAQSLVFKSSNLITK
ncbi:hypothetical protein ACFX5K_03800 [Rickettsiales bacterium LUAb2]